MQLHEFEQIRGKRTEILLKEQRISTMARTEPAMMRNRGKFCQMLNSVGL